MPTVTISAPSGSVELMAGDSINFTATLENPDNVKTTIDWTATGGTLPRIPASLPSGPRRLIPATSRFMRLLGEGLASKDTNSKAVLVRTWLVVMPKATTSNTSTCSIQAIRLARSRSPTDGTGDDSVPAGALVDSASVEIDISFDSNNPDSMQDMDVWIKSPDGTSIQVWQQTQSGSPTGELSEPAGCVQGQPATGTGSWRSTLSPAAHRMDR